MDSTRDNRPCIILTSPIHILVNTSGGPPPGLACQAPLDAYLAAFSHHLLCNPILLQALLEGMKRAGYGRIIVISIQVRQNRALARDPGKQGG